MIVREGVDDPQRALLNGIDPTNYALDEKKAERFKQEVVALMPMIEAQRVTLEERWNAQHHCWARKNTDTSRFYVGTNDAFFPVGFSNVETAVAYLQQQLFPAGPKFALRPANPMIPPAVLQKWSALMTYFLYISKMERKFPMFSRQAAVFGPTVVKNVWREESVISYVPKLDPQTGQITPGGQELTLYKGPTFQVVDILSFYVYPIFGFQDLQEAEIVYEKIDRDFRDIQALEGSVYLGTARLQNSQEMSQNSRDAIRRNTNRDFRMEPYGISTYQIRSPNLFTLNEVWCKFDLYGNGYRIPCKAVVANDIVLELRQNPYWHQRYPYRMWRWIEHQDHIYGMSGLELVTTEQSTLNAVMNQGLDALLFQVNQMVAVDMDRYQGSSSNFEMVPLAFMPFSGGGPVKEAFEFVKPENSFNEALEGANILAGSIQDSFGTPAPMQGKLSNKERTADEVERVIQGASTKIGMQARNLSLDIMQGWLEDSFLLAQQFITEDMDFKVTGMPAVHMDRESAVQEVFWQWLTTPESDAYMQQQAQQQAQQMAERQAQAEGQMTRGSPGDAGQPSPGQGLGEGEGVGSGGGPG